MRMGQTSSILRGEGFHEFAQDCGSIRRPFWMPRGELIDSIRTGREPIGMKWGIHGGSSNVYLASLRILFRDRPKGKFLDFGFGAGQPVIYAAHDGWESYGIDYSSECLTVVQGHLKRSVEAGFIEDGSVKLARGNFFPSDFRRENIDDFVAFSEARDEFEKDCPKNDPYEELGMALEEVDLFYHHQVQPMQHMLDLFAQYAKGGAEFVLTKTVKEDTHWEVPDQIELLEKAPGPIYLFRKN